MSLVVRRGRIFDPARGVDEVGDLHIEDGKIVSKAGAEEVIDAKGLLVVPGLIDMHVHLREPGGEEKETIASGVAAAVAGGFTSVAAMANNLHPTDTASQVIHIRARAAGAGLANVYPIGAVSKGLRGEELAEMGRMAEAGAVAFSDDGFPVTDSALMRHALEYAKMLRRAVIAHCEDLSLTAGAVMNEGAVSNRLGLRGAPGAAEAAPAARDILLAEMTGGRLHLAHVSARQTVDFLRAAKERGIAVTAEATPHHLTLTEDSLVEYEARFKMAPPLRRREDVEAVVAALADGTIDAVASDHAPHAAHEEERELAACPNGVVGLETTLGVVLGLVEEGKVSLARAVEALTAAPARILGIPKGTLAAGSDADVTLIDLKAKWVVDPDRFRSKGRSSPFAGRTLRGRAVHTIVGGKICF